MHPLQYLDLSIGYPTPVFPHIEIIGECSDVDRDSEFVVSFFQTKIGIRKEEVFEKIDE